MFDSGVICGEWGTAQTEMSELREFALLAAIEAYPNDTPGTIVDAAEKFLEFLTR